MKTIKQLEKEIERKDKVYGKGYFNEEVECEKKELKAQIQTLKEVLKEINKFEFAKRFADCKYFGFDNNKINKFIKEELKKLIKGK